MELLAFPRGELPIFKADEEIRFSLKGASTDKVLWDFEETEVQPGSIQIEHAFPFDSSKPAGIESTRRVDVFYREGAQYRTAWTHVEVSNLQFVSATVEGKGISLQVNQPANASWVLSQVSLGKFENGRFNVWTKIPAETGTPASSVIVNQDLLRKIGISFGPTFDPESTKKVDAYFEFVSPD